MDERVFFVVLAALTIILMPLVPSMVQLRIKFLSLLGFRRFATFHENAFGAIVTTVRGVLLVMCVLLLILAFKA